MKKLTILLVICMLFSSFPTFAASFSDTEGLACENAVEVLYALGIVEGQGNETFAPEAPLTRAEMVAFILRILSVPQGAGEDIFEDVTPIHWAYGPISTAYSMEIVHGIDEKTFAPDKELSLEEATKMLVSAMGYEVQAASLGGYPSGYMVKAQQLGLFEGINFEDGFTRGDIAQLLYRALDKPLSEKASYGTDKLEFSENADATLLSKYLKVEEVKDMITATKETWLSQPASPLSETEAVLSSGRVISIGNRDYTDYVGLPAKLYIKRLENDEVPTLLAVIPSGGAKLTKVSAEKIAGNSDTRTFIYDEDTKENKLDIQGAAWIYNGRPVSPDASLIKPAIGNVVLTEGAGGNVTAVRIESYVNAVCDFIKEKDDSIGLKETVKLGGKEVDRIFTGKGSTHVYLADKTGAELTLLDIAEGDVLSIAASLDGAVYKIIRSSEKTEGTITEISENNITVSGTEYVLDAALMKNASKKDLLNVGTSAFFRLDFLGNIADVTKEDLSAAGTSADDKKYGWLVAATNRKGLSGEPQFKIFTEDGEMKVYGIGESLRINDAARQKADVHAILSGTSAKPEGIWNTYPDPKDAGKMISGVEPQLVKFKTDDTGATLKELWTAENKTDVSENEKFGASFSMDYYMNKGGYAGRMKVWNGTKEGAQTLGTYGVEYMEGGIVFGKVAIMPETPYFIIPEDMNNDKAYRVLDMIKEFDMDKFRTKECISFYDVSEKYILGAMVQHDYLSGTGSTVEPQYPVYTDLMWGVVTNVTRVLDEDDESVLKLTVIDDYGKTQEFIWDEEMACGYKVTDADYKADPDWYVKDGETKTYCPDLQGSERPENAYIDIERLDVGDVVHYLVGAKNALRVINCVYRANYPGMVSYSASKGKVTVLSAQNYYYGGEAYLNGTVYGKSPAGVMIKTGLGDIKTNYSGTDTIYTVPKTGRFMLCDLKEQTITPVSLEEIMKDDVVFSVWRLTEQKFFVIYR